MMARLQAMKLVGSSVGCCTENNEENKQSIGPKKERIKEKDKEKEMMMVVLLLIARIRFED